MPLSDYKIFQKEFKKWQIKFGLTGWAVYFDHKQLNGECANISYDLENMTAVVTLNSKPTKDERKDDPVKSLAKHEAIHLMLAEFKCIAGSRFVARSELIKADEEIVNKLMELIK